MKPTQRTSSLLVIASMAGLLAGPAPARAECTSPPSDAWALDAYPVPPLVNNVRNNGPELVERLQPPPEPLTRL